MKPELEQKLFEKYPTLYKDLYGDMRETCMHWGFEHGDGWYNLIDELSAKILEIDPTTVAEQVKEKLGTIRFYYRCDDKDAYGKIQKLIWEYEEKSSMTCEICGEVGILESENYWLSTLCQFHRNEKNKKRK
jgi:hypothetical protein